MEPGPLCQEVAEGGAGAAEGSGEGHVEHAGPLLVAHVHQGDGAPEAGVVDGHVEPAVPLHHRPVEVLDVFLVGSRRRGYAGTGTLPSAESSSAVSASRRSWASETTTAAPSSTQRRAVAEPIPVPAAAVTTTTLPSSRAWPAGGGGGGGGVKRFAEAHVVTLGSAGRPRTRSPMMVRWISLDPP